MDPEILHIFYLVADNLQVNDIHSLMKTCKDVYSYLSPKLKNRTNNLVKLLSKKLINIEKTQSKFPHEREIRIKLMGDLSNCAIALGFIHNLETIRINKIAFKTIMLGKSYHLIPQIIGKSNLVKIAYNIWGLECSKIINIRESLAIILPMLKENKESIFYTISSLKYIKMMEGIIFWIFLELTHQLGGLVYSEFVRRMRNRITKIKHLYGWLKNKEINIDWKEIYNCSENNRVKKWLIKKI